jgi:hypothetical protein
MDFFYHHPSITTKVSIGLVNNYEPNFAFFDRVSVGSEDLKRIFSGPLSDLAVNITPEPLHPAFPPTGLVFWVAPPERKVRQGASPIKLLMHD